MKISRWLKKNKWCWRKQDLNCSKHLETVRIGCHLSLLIPRGLMMFWFKSFPMELKQRYQVLRWRKYWKKAKPKKTNNRRKMTKHWKTARRGKWKYTIYGIWNNRKPQSHLPNCCRSFQIGTAPVKSKDGKMLTGVMEQKHRSVTLK